MNTSTRDITKPRKPRAPAAGAPVVVRMQPDQLVPLDTWIAEQPAPQPSRPEVIRSALRDWLADQVPPSGDNEGTTTAKGFLKAADGHKEAAKQINLPKISPNQNTPSIFLGFYLLVGQSIEGLLKAYLAQKGYKSSDLQQKFGHKLIKLYNRAVKEGINELHSKYKIHINIDPSAFEKIVKSVARHHGDYTYRYVKDDDYSYTYFEDTQMVLTVLDYIHYIIQEEIGLGE
ncbi:hypothetical protein EEDFHM_02342 [Methylorubrum populi]